MGWVLSHNVYIDPRACHAETLSILRFYALSTCALMTIICLKVPHFAGQLRIREMESYAGKEHIQELNSRCQSLT
jgi:hypothetical protein